MKYGRQVWTWQHTMLTIVLFVGTAVMVAAYLIGDPEARRLPISMKIFFWSVPFMAALGMYVVYLLDRRPLE